MKEECIICKAPLIYLEKDEMMECVLCHKKELSKTRCEQGHYVCNECHTKGMGVIIDICLSETSKNPIEIIRRMMAQPLFTTSISEVCFYTDDIDFVYKTLIENHVECLSEPQYFDFRADGFGESRAFYFRDPDGIILEMMQPL